jgi:hypothetical protein
MRYFPFIAFVFLFLFIGITLSLAQRPTFNCHIEGHITDSVNHEPLRDVAVILLHHNYSVVSDMDGTFRLGLPQGVHTIGFRLLGYGSKQIEINGTSDTVLRIELAPDIKFLQEVSVTGYNPQLQVNDLNTGYIHLSRKEISSLPVLLGETDFYKAIQLMPGIKTTGEGNAAIYVRGGATDQNLLLLDKATVYNPTHLLGFYSVFNSDVVNDVTVIKSGIPAEYGNRLSSVIDFNTKKDIPDQINFKGFVGLLSSRIGMEVPLVDRKIGISFFARKTYLNTWLSLIKTAGFVKKKSILYKAGYDFYDLNATVNVVIDKNNRLSLGFYDGRDLLHLDYQTVDLTANLEWGNKVGSVTWKKIFNENFFMENSLTFSTYNLNLDLSQNLYTFNLISEIKDYGFKTKFTYLLPNQKINFGASVIYHNLIPNSSQAASDTSQLNFGSSSRYYSTESSLFVSDEISLNPKLDFSFGFRFNSFDHFGPFSEYNQNEAGDNIDTLHYRKGNHLRNYTGLDVRASLRYLIRDNLSLKFSFNSNNQYIHLVNASSVSFPTDFWVSSSTRVKPQKGYQWAVGVYRFIEQLKLEASIEVYYKTLTHQIEFYKGIFNAMDNSSFDENLVFGKGRAYGAEFLIRKTIGKLTGWIGYTLSKTERSFAAIENGRWFPAKYDKPQDLSIVTNYTFNKRWVFSAVFVYSTGSTYTPVVGRYFIGNNVINEYGRYNSARMPVYHRCDISATLLLKKTATFESKLLFSVYNVYNRKNPFCVFPEVRGNLAHYSLSIAPKEISIFPVLPSIGWEFCF